MAGPLQTRLSFIEFLTADMDHKKIEINLFQSIQGNPAFIRGTRKRPACRLMSPENGGHPDE